MRRGDTHAAAVLGRWRQEGGKEIQVSLGYTARPYLRGKEGDRTEKNEAQNQLSGKVLVNMSEALSSIPGAQGKERINALLSFNNSPGDDPRRWGCRTHA